MELLAADLATGWGRVQPWGVSGGTALRFKVVSWLSQACFALAQPDRGCCSSPPSSLTLWIACSLWGGQRGGPASGCCARLAELQPWSTPAMWSPSSWVLLTLPVMHGGCVRVCQQHHGLMQHTEV